MKKFIAKVSFLTTSIYVAFMGAFPGLALAQNPARIINNITREINAVRAPMTGLAIAAAILCIIVCGIGAGTSKDEQSRKRWLGWGAVIFGFCIFIGAAPWIPEFAIGLGS